MAKIISKFGEQQLVMVNYACGFNQSKTEKYFEWIIINVIPFISSNGLDFDLFFIWPINFEWRDTETQQYSN